MKIGIRFYFTLIGYLIIFTAASCHSANKTAKTTTKYGNIDLNLTRGALAIFISSDNEIFINDEKTPLADMSHKIKELAESKSPNDVVFLKGEDLVKYGIIVSVFSAIREANINRVNLIVGGGEISTPSEIIETEISPKLPPLEEIKNQQYLVQFTSDPLFVILKSASGLNQEVTLNAKPMTSSELKTTLEDVLRRRPEDSREICIRAPTTKSYNEVLEATKIVHQAGATLIKFQLEYLDDNVDLYLFRRVMGGA